MSTSARIDAGIALTWLVAAVLAAGCFGQSRLIGLVTNSDALLPAAFIWELLAHPESWRGFEWPRVPSLFPDLTVYGAMQAVSGSWRAAQLGYAMASMAALATLAGVIAQQTAKIAIAAGAMAFLAATGLILCLEWAIDPLPWHLHILAPAYHSGPFILSVACLALAPRETAQVTRRLIAMALLAALGAFSDRLFIGMFLMPLLAGVTMAARAGDIARRASLRVAGIAIAGCLIGVLADKAVFPELLSRQMDIPLNAALMLRRTTAFVAQPDGWAVLIADAGLLAPLVFGRLRGAELFWWTVGAAAAIPVSLLTGGLWEDAGSRRYLATVMWWPLLLMVPFAAARVGRLGMPISAGIAVLCAGGLAAGAPPGRAILEWRDTLGACLLPTGRTAGLADYWVARRTTVGTDWQLQVAPVDRVGAGRIWGSNPVWLNADQRDANRPPAFSFIVMTNLDAEAIRARYGAPSGILHCRQDAVWLYDDAAAIGRALAAATPQRLLPGEARCVGPDALRTTGGALPSGPLQADPKRASRRPTTWGPNLDLPTGRWRIAMRYRLASAEPGADRWEIAGLYAGTRLHSAALPATGSAIATVTAEIDLPRPIQAVETRSFIAGDGRIEILGASFEPIGRAGTAARCTP